MYRFSSMRRICKKFVNALRRFSELLDRLEEFNHFKQDEFLTINEAAAHCKVTDRTLRRWKESGLIKPVLIGKTIHYSKSGLLEAVIANRLIKK